MNKINCFLFSLLLISNVLSAQENMGIATSNYAPTNTVLINPSSIADSKVYWEINLVGLSTFIGNNYIFIPSSSILSSIRNPDAIREPEDNFNSTDKNLYADISLHGPSFTATFGKHAVGLNTQVRTIADGSEMPFHLAKFTKEGFKYLPQRGIDFSGKNIRLNAMSWGEIGLNYAYIFKQEKTNQFIGGISLKRLFGITHLGMNINELEYIVPDTVNINFSNTSAKYGFTNPAFNSGSGWSIDLGFTYKRALGHVDTYTPYSTKSNCRKMTYLYKIGVSLLDLGWINYNSGAFYGEVDGQPGQLVGYSNAEFGEADENDIQIQEIFPTINNQRNNYKAFLPSALSIQYDYSFQNGFYLNGTIIQNISILNQLGVNRQNSLAIVPRYEISRFEVSMPFTLRRYRYPSIGLAIRLWNNIIIGTDRLTPWLIKGNTYGLDFYFNLKLAKLYTRKCKARKPTSKFSTYRTNDCYY